MRARIATRRAVLGTALAGLAFASMVHGTGAPVAAAATWTTIDADADHVGRTGPAGCFDTRRGLFTLVGGLTSVVCIGGYSAYGYPPEALVHHLDANVPWTHVSPAGSAPQLAGGAAVYDSLGDRVWLYGGVHYSGSPPNIVSTYSNTGYALDLVTETWQAHPATGASPPTVIFPELVLDTSARRLLVLGGSDGTTAVGGVYQMPLGTPGVWQALSPAGPAPAPRWGACAVYDPDSNRVLVAGGVVSSSTPSSEVWALDLSGVATWRLLATTGSPPAGRCWGALDRRAGRLLVFGGKPMVVRSLDLHTRQWEVLSASGTLPDSGMYYNWATSAFDPVRRRFLDAWPTEFSTWCNGPSYAYTYVLDVSADYPVAVTAPGAARSFVLGTPFPAPARDAFTVRLELPDDVPTRVEVVDVAGRRRWSAWERGAGTHLVVVDARRFGPGMVFVRAMRGDRTELRRAVLLH